MKINIGDRVMFSRKFCQSVGAYTGWFPFAVGTVLALNGSIATIKWDDIDETKHVRISNLILKNRRHLEAT